MFNNRKIYNESLVNFNNIVLDTQNKRLKEIILRTINDIDVEENLYISETKLWFEKTEQALDNMISNREFEDSISIVKKLDSELIKEKKINIILLDKDTEEIQYSTDKNIVINTFVKEQELLDYSNNYRLKIIRETDDNKSLIIIGLTQEEIDFKVKEIVSYEIRETKLEDGSYIWINEIIDYNGGENYAKRIVHPNLLETEGDYISTSQKDLKGNSYYLKELNDINKTGEAYNKYYFKKMNSENVSLKLTYSKLYPKYNWVIGTGVHLDELEKHNQIQRDNYAKELGKQIKGIILNSLLLIIISIIIGAVVFNYNEIKKKKLLEEKLNIGKYHYNILESKYDEGNKILHDIKNHLLCIDALAKENELNKLIDYLGGVNNDINKYSSIIITGNKVIDIVLNETYKVMNNNDIKYKHKIEKLDLSFIEDKDLVNLFSNLLNNAIEGSKNSLYKQIEFMIYSFNQGYIVIKLINSCDVKPKIKGSNLITSKNNKDYHGYGVKIINSIVEKYNGDVNWKYDECKKEFNILIMIPIN